MRVARICLGLLLLAAFGTAASPKQITLDDLGRSNPGPSFDNGYVVGWAQAGHKSVTLYARDGHKVFEIPSLELADGTSAFSLSAAADTDGTLALAYTAKSDTRGGIALLDQTGKPIRVIETEPYMPSQICFAPDHSIWMFGDQYPRPANDFLTFRHYSREGKQLGAYIPRSKLPAWEGGGLDQVVSPFLGFWRLRAIKDRIGASLHLGPFKWAWVELDLNGNLLREWTYTDTTADWFEPTAFTSDGSLYGWIGTYRKRVGIGLFDKATSTWKIVPSLPNGRLIGADGDQLVYQDGDQLRFLQQPDPTAIQTAARTR